MDRMKRVHKETEGPLTYVVDIEYERDNPYWDMPEEELKQFWRDVDNGDLLWFGARVQCLAAGVVLGEDYLGSCCYDSIQSFVQDGYYMDAKLTARAEAIEKLHELSGVLDDLEA